jgi:hypothetical protein
VRALLSLSVVFWLLIVVAAVCKGDEGLLEDAVIHYNVPKNPGLTLSLIEEPIFRYNKPECLGAFVSAMEATDLPKISPNEKKMYLASLKLADVLYLDSSHQRILIAVALRWQVQGMTNPIATAWKTRWKRETKYTEEQLFVTVTDDELDLLYKQVLIDQGFVSGTVDNKDVYKILYK